MPVLLRAAHVDEVPPGTSLVRTVRGHAIRIVHLADRFFAFDAEEAPMVREVSPADLAWARQKGATEYRAVARGTYVHVALDAARESAPAQVQSNARPPERR